ncbi:MAG: hypothetical protein IAF02_18185 [Anaerolineae bacterium]|nr:hypothetical protein [Anaerolineae bacterium]
MSCCGDKRRQFPVRDSAPPTSTPRPMHTYTVSQNALGKVFEYTGHTTLTVRGPITGQLYRFSKLHVRVAVDGRDASALMGVPNLRVVSQQTN